MLGGKIATVIRVKYRRNARECPLRQGFAPNRLAQRQSGLDRGWGLKAESETCNGPTIIIHNDRKPRACQWLTAITHPNIQQRMIGLPDVIRFVGFAPVQEIVGHAVRFTALMGQGDQRWVKLVNDAVHMFVIGNSPPMTGGDVTYWTVDKRNGGRRLAQRQAFNRLFKFGV